MCETCRRKGGCESHPVPVDDCQTCVNNIVGAVMKKIIKHEAKHGRDAKSEFSRMILEASAKVLAVKGMKMPEWPTGAELEAILAEPQLEGAEAFLRASGDPQEALDFIMERYSKDRAYLLLRAREEMGPEFEAKIAEDTPDEASFVRYREELIAAAKKMNLRIPFGFGEPAEPVSQLPDEEFLKQLGITATDQPEKPEEDEEKAA